MQERKSGCARLSACPMERFRNRAVTKLVPLLHHEPPVLLVAEVKLRDGGSFGCFLIPCLDRAEVFPALGAAGS